MGAQRGPQPPWEVTEGFLKEVILKIKLISGNSLAVQWLGLHAFTARAQVRSLVGELRPHKPRDMAKKQKR